MPSPSAQHRAIAAGTGFALVGIAGAWFTTDHWFSTWPLHAFYFLIVLNTYFSVRCFSDIHGAEAVTQKVIDTLLVILYILLALQFGSILRFVFVTTILFVIATLKYSFLLAQNDHAPILRRKIILDALCTLACLLALGGVLAGSGYVSALLWFVAFVIGNLYVLLFSKLYAPIR